MHLGADDIWCVDLHLLRGVLAAGLDFARARGKTVTAISISYSPKRNFHFALIPKAVFPLYNSTLWCFS